MATRKKTTENQETNPTSAPQVELKLPKAEGLFRASEYGPHVCWYDYEHGEGGAISPHKEVNEKINWEDPDEVDNWRFERVCLEITKILPNQPHDLEGFVFESEAARKKYAALANKIMRTLTTRTAPMPDWMVQALAHGWKPPEKK